MSFNAYLLPVIHNLSQTFKPSFPNYNFLHVVSNYTQQYLHHGGRKKIPNNTKTYSRQLQHIWLNPLTLRHRLIIIHCVQNTKTAIICGHSVNQDWTTAG
jgi:hypothetical protein